MNEYLSKKIRIISFISILLVFFQHAINFTGYIDPHSIFADPVSLNMIIQYTLGYGVARLAVPMFFILSAYLFYTNFNFSKLLQKYITRIRSLLIPYVLWNMLSLTGIFLLQLIPQLNIFFADLYTGSVMHLPLIRYVQLIWTHGISFQLWFLFDLMIYTLFAPVIYVTVRYLGIWIILPAFSFWMTMSNLPSWASLLGRGGLFYLVGAYIAMHPVKPRIAPRKISILSGFLWILVIAMKTVRAFTPHVFQMVDIGQIDNLTIVFGLIFVWFFYDEIASGKFIQWCERWSLYTFFIYAFHEPLLELLKITLLKTIGISNLTMTIGFFMVPALTFTISMGVAKIFRKSAYPFYKILTGGR